MKDVERFMKHYFLVAKDVGDSPRSCVRAGRRADEAGPVLSRDDRAASPGRRRLPDGDDFLIDNNRLTIARQDVFARDPVNLLRMFRLAQKHDLAPHPDAMRRRQARSR